MFIVNAHLLCSFCSREKSTVGKRVELLEDVSSTHELRMYVSSDMKKSTKWKAKNQEHKRAEKVFYVQRAVFRRLISVFRGA